MIRFAFVVVAVLAVAGCDQKLRQELNRTKALLAEVGGDCQEIVTLVATTAASPSVAICKHPKHRIEVQPSTLSGEEIGAVVVCRCGPFGPLILADGGVR